MCCLGLTSLLTLPADQLPGEALERVFKATLELLVAYKDQVAGVVSFRLHFILVITMFFLWPFVHVSYISLNVFLLEAAKEVSDDGDDMDDGLETDDEYEDDGSDKDMGVDAEDGDEADSLRLQRLAAQVFYSCQTFLYIYDSKKVMNLIYLLVF